MPTITVTVRYKKFEDNDTGYFNQLKQQEKRRILENYPGATDIKQSVITDGIPDFVAAGELRAKNQVAIRTEFTGTQAEVDELKKGRRV